MKILTLAKKEAQDIIGNKIYVLVIFVQILIILGAFGLAFFSSVATDPVLLDQLGVTSSIKIGLSEDLKGTSIAKELESQKFQIKYYSVSNKPQNLRGTGLVAFIDTSSTGDVKLLVDNSNVFYPVISSKISIALDNYQVEKSLRGAGYTSQQINEIKNPVILQEVKVGEEAAAPIALDSPYFVEVMYGFIVPFILLLPFFLASNIVTDSIVGERERKTFEVLLMAPLSSFMVVVGKILPILVFSLIQSCAWIILLDILKVPIYNPILIFIILFFMGLAFIGLGIFISLLVDSTKEANSAITILLVFATFVLFVPLFVKSGIFEGFLNFIPTVLIVRISSNPNINPQIILYIIPTILISILIFIATSRYFRHERAIRL
jgi:ABC-2 type transport system permease protein